MAKKIKIPKKKHKEKIHLFDYNDGKTIGGAKEARIEIFSNKSALIERCRGIYEYSDTFIKLNLGGVSGIFVGKNLKISSLEDKNLMICGDIEAVNFVD